MKMQLAMADYIHLPRLARPVHLLYGKSETRWDLILALANMIDEHINFRDVKYSSGSRVDWSTHATHVELLWQMLLRDFVIVATSDVVGRYPHADLRMSPAFAKFPATAVEGQWMMKLRPSDCRNPISTPNINSMQSIRGTGRDAILAWSKRMVMFEGNTHWWHWKALALIEQAGLRDIKNLVMS